LAHLSGLNLDETKAYFLAGEVALATSTDRDKSFGRSVGARGALKVCQPYPSKTKHMPLVNLDGQMYYYCEDISLSLKQSRNR